MATTERIPDLRLHIAACADDLEALRQNSLLNESAFLSFSRERGLSVKGVTAGEPGEFHGKGWLTSDGNGTDAKPLFHPFRMYTLHRILQLQRTMLFRLEGQANPPELERLADLAQDWNGIVDLAILLEPLYWPDIVGHVSFHLSWVDHQSRMDRYREKVRQLVNGLNPSSWRAVHESLRVDAAWLDRNHEWYALLRIANWAKRKSLQGQVSGALWIRHIAEVIRRALEEVHSERWLEEDQAFGFWLPGARQKRFGSDRPFDDTLRAKPYIAYNFGLFTGSALRWCVEGATEYYAVLEAIPEPSRFAIELVDLNGSVTLDARLRADRAHRRFSIISFDGDERANIKAIRRQVELGNVVGSIFMHYPDFEFANFAIEELIAVAAGIDDSEGYPGDAIRREDRTGVSGAGALAKWYRTHSKRGRDLKGERWGKELAAYAREHPRRSDNGEERPFWKEVRVAFHGWNSDYDFQRDHFTFDLDTFNQIPRPAPAG